MKLTGKRLHDFIKSHDGVNSEETKTAEIPNTPPTGKCIQCHKTLVPVGQARKGGDNSHHKDWNSRRLHKKCHKELEDKYYDLICLFEKEPCFKTKQIYQKQIINEIQSKLKSK